ncbi:hypothetical protein PENDEC_c001G06268 [Penicillium decumbens]|uniref:Integrase catalytic domain-containing protein n=1 Tax=Penicillium decumbens TaxID=69771 RepID=A0A1V6PNV7_PENDC|nr:hypothetical protein PENDEC_c001G06268 [Penicillium decumbens]
MDFITALPPAKHGFDCVLTITDKFTKLIGLLPGKETWASADWAKAVVEYIWATNWGIPMVIISDRDPKFVQGFWKAFFTKLGVDMFYSAVYHPQSDGQSERTNQTVEIMLRHWVATHPAENWLSALAAL